jgi:hypothetical protein
MLVVCESLFGSYLAELGDRLRVREVAGWGCFHILARFYFVETLVPADCSLRGLFLYFQSDLTYTVLADSWYVCVFNCSNLRVVALGI